MRDPDQTSSGLSRGLRRVCGGGVQPPQTALRQQSIREKALKSLPSIDPHFKGAVRHFRQSSFHISSSDKTPKRLPFS